MPRQYDADFTDANESAFRNWFAANLDVARDDMPTFTRFLKYNLRNYGAGLKHLDHDILSTVYGRFVAGNCVLYGIEVPFDNKTTQEEIRKGYLLSHPEGEGSVKYEDQTGYGRNGADR